MVRRAGVIAVVLCLAGVTTAAAADARIRKAHHPVTRLHVVDARPVAALVLPVCAVEVYPYAPSQCLPGGSIEFDNKAYFAPSYGIRAYRYFDGW